MNVPNRRPDRDADVVGYELDLLDGPGRAGVEDAWGDPAALAEARRRVRGALSPLDAYAVEPPSPGLVRAVLNRVEEARRVIPLGRAAFSPANDAYGRRGGPLLTLREIVSVAAAILVFVGILIPGYRTARTAAQRTMCLNNLRMIGTGYAEYAEAFANAWPFAGVAPDEASWLRVTSPGTPQMSNSRHVFRLVQCGYVPSGAFHCAGRAQDVPLAADALDGLDDFPDDRSNSYSTNFVDRPLYRSTFVASMPIASDHTPLVEGGRLTPVGPSGNSRSHGQPGGQNVLYANMTVTFTTTPRVGVDHDDIYRIIGVREYTGRERPSSRSDTFLIP